MNELETINIDLIRELRQKGLSMEARTQYETYLKELKEIKQQMKKEIIRQDRKIITFYEPEYFAKYKRRSVIINKIFKKAIERDNVRILI